MQPLNLSKALPFAAVTFTIASFASMGLPGFSGFVAELQILVGAWQTFPTLTVVAGIGIVLGVAYALRALQKAFFAEHEREPVTAAASNVGVGEPLRAITLPERIGAVLLIGASLVIGLYPRLFLDLIVPSLNSPLFARLGRLHP